MSLELRQATPEDAPALTALMNEIIAAGGTTAFKSPFDTDRMTREFIAPPTAISCFAAYENARLLGFQVLFWRGDYPGAYALPEDWALIGSYVSAAARGKGVGAALFERTRAAAKAAGVRYIDATIRKENAGGQIFYTRLGFEDYADAAETISKRLAP